MSPTSFTLSVEDNGAVISTLIWWCFVNDRYNQGNLSELVRRALFDDVGLATEFLFCLVKADFKLSEVSIFFFFFYPSFMLYGYEPLYYRTEPGWLETRLYAVNAEQHHFPLSSLLLWGTRASVVVQCLFSTSPCRI